MKLFFTLSRHDLIVIFIWPLINTLLAYSIIQYYVILMQARVNSTQLLVDVPVFLFIISFSFWGGSKLCYCLFSTFYNIHNHMVINMVINMVMVIVAINIGLQVSPLSLKDPVPMLQFISYLNILLQVLIYTAVVHIWRLKRHAIELEVSLKKSEISLLRMQTNPHFLFNTLSLISNEIPFRPKLAQELIFDLSDLLRGTIAMSEKRRINVNEECLLVENYLSIQKARFGNRLNFQLNIDESSIIFSVPPMLIVPLVENVIKHAVSKTDKTITLVISLLSSGSNLIISVCNSWPEDYTPTFLPGSGHQNIIDTLRLEYTKASFTIDYLNGETLAQISINHDFNGEYDA